MYDTAIIGSGPAGLSAAINLKIRNKDLIWFGSKSQSVKVERSEKILNYPGFAGISGSELNEAFKRHAREMGISMTDKMVTSVMPGKDNFMLLAENEIYEAKTLLLCIGVSGKKAFAGEKEFLGRGVSYCATCDGFLYKGKTIVVYCGSKEFEHEAVYLADLAGKVYLYAAYKGCRIDLPNVEYLDKPVKEVKGGLKMSATVLSDGSEIEADGLFCLRDFVAADTLIPGLALDGAHIVVNRKMETSLKGCCAAGDCTGRPYQIAKAVGEGNVAAHSILEYLAENS